MGNIYKKINKINKQKLKWKQLKKNLSQNFKTFVQGFWRNKTLGKSQTKGFWKRKIESRKREIFEKFYEI